MSDESLAAGLSILIAGTVPAVPASFPPLPPEALESTRLF